MRAFFQTAVFTSDQKEIWTKPKDLESQKIKSEVVKASKEGKAIYYSIQFRSGNTTLYPFLFIDIDASELEKAKVSCTKIIQTLIENKLSEDHYQIYFSGYKGFHILIDSRCFFGGRVPTSEEFSPKLQKQIVKLISEKALLKEDAQPDEKVFRKRGMIRAPFSRNYKSGLFKIPLSFSDLNSDLHKIKSLAATSHNKFSEIFDESLSFFCTSPVNIEYLENCKIQAAAELEATKIAKEKFVKQEGFKPSRSNKINQTLNKTENIHLGCRAIRTLTADIIKDRTASAAQRIMLAHAFFETDSQNDYIHSVLSKTKEYSFDKTSTNLKKVFGSISCDKLIADGVCKKKCKQYRKLDNHPSNSPSYFGMHQEQSNWAKATDATYVSSVAKRLREYHKTTTDFFDWTNSNQFMFGSEAYSEAISDSVRKNSIPHSESILITVKKEDNKERQLIRTHFESELMSSLFVEQALVSNKRFKENRVLAQNVYSYGYQDEDSTKFSLIRSWMDEYSSFKRTLRNISSDNTYQFVYSDDLKNFYPSFSKDMVKGLLDEIYGDTRSSALLLDLLSEPLRLHNNGERTSKSIGLPQGPLVAHVIAARLLLKIDEFISRQFEIEELILVRYCDDLIFFCRDQDILEKLTTVVIPELERLFKICFHKDIKSNKTSSLDIESYRNERLENDLFKYQIKFESELSKADEETKKELLNLLTNIFGATLEKFLSKESQYNSKDLERMISSIRWRMPDLISGDIDISEQLDQLTEKLIYFLNVEIISYKLRTNLVILILNILEAASAKNNKLTDKVLNFYKDTKVSSSKQTLLYQLVREICLTSESQLFDLAKGIVNESLNKSLDYLDNSYIRELSYLLKRRSQSAEYFDTDVWLPSQEGMHANLSYLVKSNLNSESDPAKLKSLCSDSDSEFIFHYRFFLHKFRGIKNNLNIRTKYDFYRIAFEFNLEDLKNILLPETVYFIQEGICEKDIEDEIGKQKQTVLNIVSSAFALETSSLSILSNIDSNSVFKIDQNEYVIDYAGSSLLAGISFRKIETLCHRISSLGILGEVRVIQEPGKYRPIIVYRLPLTGSVSAYMDHSNRLDEIIDCELSFFKEILKEKLGRLPILSLSAKAIGFQYWSEPRFFGHGLKVHGLLILDRALHAKG